MSFCKATRTYFNASEGIEAVNQFGKKHLYSPYANFFYCIECDERLVTEQTKFEYEPITPPWMTVDETKNYKTKKIVLEIKDLNYIRKQARKHINSLVKRGFIQIEYRRNNNVLESTAQYIYQNFENNLKIYNDFTSIKTIVRMSDKYFQENIKRLKNKTKPIYVLAPDERMDTIGQGVCKKHMNDYIKCDECGNWEKPENITEIETTDDDTLNVCEHCLEETYILCDECQRYINTNINSYEEIGTKIYCIECRNENFTQCEDCGEWIENENILETEDGHFFCEYCWSDNTEECCDCGQTYWNVNMEYDEDEGAYYCRHCRGEGSSVILNYSYKPIPLRHAASGEKELFGIEIEVEGNKGKAKSFLEQFGDIEKKDIYLKNDGSVAGFEIVTQPMSRKYFYREFVPKLEKGMKYLRNNGFKGHNRAGIHIHVSTEAINEDMLKKMMILMYSKQKKTYELWLKITQRKDSQMSQWSSMSPESLLNCDKKYVAKELDKNKNAKRRKKPNLSSSRYTAINCRNTDTIEFRIFNSNIRTERIIKNAQVIFALIDFTKTDRLPTMNNYLKFIQKNSEVYKELYDFLVEKEIIQPKEKAEKIDELMEVMNVKSIEGLKKELTSIQMKQLKPTSLSELNSEDDERNIQCA